MMYAARVFNVLAFVAALAFSFRLAPGYRAVMTAVALVPMTLHQAGAISGDLVTIALSFVALSLVLHSREHRVARRLSDPGRTRLYSAGSLQVEHLGASPPMADPRVDFQAIGGHGSCTLSLLSRSARSRTLLIWNGMMSDNIPALRVRQIGRRHGRCCQRSVGDRPPVGFRRQLLGKSFSNYKGEAGTVFGHSAGHMFSLPLWVRSLYLLLLLFVAVAGVLRQAISPMGARQSCSWCSSSERFSFTPRWLSPTARSVRANLDTCSVLYDPGPGKIFPSVLPRRTLDPSTESGRTCLKSTLLAVVTVVGTIHAMAALVLIRSTLYL